MLSSPIVIPSPHPPSKGLNAQQETHSLSLCFDSLSYGHYYFMDLDLHGSYSSLLLHSNYSDIHKVWWWQSHHLSWLGYDDSWNNTIVFGDWSFIHYVTPRTLFRVSWNRSVIFWSTNLVHLKIMESKKPPHLIEINQMKTVAVPR